MGTNLPLQEGAGSGQLNYPFQATWHEIWWWLAGGARPARWRAVVENLQFYLLVLVPTLAGLGLFGLLRGRDTQPVVAGCAAMVLAVGLVAAFFAFIILT